MFYVHEDQYPEDEWWQPFVEILEKENKSFQVIDLLDFEDFDQVTKDDYLFARLGQKKEEKKAINSKLDKIYSSWEQGKVFPSRKSYELYDDKLKEFNLLKKLGYNTPKTKLVRDNKDLISFLSKSQIDFPIVLKKRFGAGAEYVWKFESFTQISSNIFPVLVQNYIETDFDVRLFFAGNKFFGFKRLHSDGEKFPYGSEWYNVKVEPISNIIDTFCRSYIERLWVDFYEELESPTMSFDIIFDERENPVILEFSYCFAYKMVLNSSHYIELPEFDLNRYYSNGEYDNFESLNQVIFKEIFEWLNS